MRSGVITEDLKEMTRPLNPLLFVLVFLAATATVATASAQQPNDQEDPKLKPRVVTLLTKDRVPLKAYYFPSGKAKEAPTVLLVHEWQGQASPYLKLVMALQESGCAVLVPDYRGHGGSKQYIGRGGKPEEFKLGQMSRRDIEKIVVMDLESSKKFLVEENNAGNLNVNALVVIGVREGCVMATHFAARDWSFPSVGRRKQGQDVKALVLISPEKQIKSVAIDQALNHPAVLSMPIMIVAGETSPEASEAQRLGKRIESIKHRVGGGTAVGFESKLPQTALSGPALVNEVPKVFPAIVEFVRQAVPTSNGMNPWIERE